MLSRLLLSLLFLASVFISFGPWVEAIRYDLANVALEGGEEYLKHASDSKIVVLFEVDDKTPAGSRFKKEVGYDHAREVLNEADYFVLGLLKEYPIERGYLGGTVTVESFTGCENVTGTVKVADTTGSHIRLNSDYIDNFKGDVKAEFDGIVYHEITRVWLWNGQGEAPNWLLSGIADYARLTSGHPSKDWPKRLSGSSWTEGYAVTAYFIEYLSEIHKGFVPEMNAMMKTYYSNEYFVKILGKSLDDLWKDYKSGKAPTPAPAPAPSAKY
ncbi:hypothetical protein MLD38_013712 [Melastoma candidum]|uniref:Uncharacterized protein n=1 Tax=Melastoma candidum TaxID=119954 RepID=A0ACB9RAF1_9MYRT|nr:hypothetical protein MLD38_013712 [Melastoma candidum]